VAVPADGDVDMSRQRGERGGRKQKRRRDGDVEMADADGVRVEVHRLGVPCILGMSFLAAPELPHASSGVHMLLEPTRHMRLAQSPTAPISNPKHPTGALEETI
jgi:hypothetical protein